MKLLLGILIGVILMGSLWLVAGLNCERAILQAHHDGAVACEDARNRAQDFGKERNKLWREISRLKGRKNG